MTCEPAIILIAVGVGGHACILEAQGQPAYTQLAVDSWDPSNHFTELPEEPGIYVWEGVLTHQPDYGDYGGVFGYEAVWLGVFRPAIPGDLPALGIKLATPPLPGSDRTIMNDTEARIAREIAARRASLDAPRFQPRDRVTICSLYLNGRFDRVPAVVLSCGKRAVKVLAHCDGQEIEAYCRPEEAEKGWSLKALEHHLSVVGTCLECGATEHSQTYTGVFSHRPGCRLEVEAR